MSCRRPQAEQAGSQEADEDHEHDPQALAYDAGIALGVPVQDNPGHGQPEDDGEQGVRPFPGHRREMLDGRPQQGDHDQGRRHEANEKGLTAGQWRVYRVHARQTSPYGAF